MARCSWLACSQLDQDEQQAAKTIACGTGARAGFLLQFLLTPKSKNWLPGISIACRPPRLFPPDAGLFRLTRASHGAFEGFFIPCPGFGGSSVLSVETSFPTEFMLLAFGPRLDLVGGTPRRN